jgi:hypothetical protein
MNIRSTAANAPTGREGKPLAVSVRTMCSLLDIGATKGWELISTGRVKTFSVGRKRLVVFSSIEALVAGGGSNIGGRSV